MLLQRGFEVAIPCLGHCPVGLHAAVVLVGLHECYRKLDM